MRKISKPHRQEPTERSDEILLHKKLNDLIQMKEFVFYSSRLDMEGMGATGKRRQNDISETGESCSSGGGSCGGGGGSCRF